MLRCRHDVIVKMTHVQNVNFNKCLKIEEVISATNNFQRKKKEISSESNEANEREFYKYQRELVISSKPLSESNQA